MRREKRNEKNNSMLDTNKYKYSIISRYVDQKCKKQRETTNENKKKMRVFVFRYIFEQTNTRWVW